MPDVASQTFDFVARELNATLTRGPRARSRSYVEQPENVALLERCTQELHQVQGVLRVLEIYGAALLAEEMEQVAQLPARTAAERKNQAESLDALMRAMVQLPRLPRARARRRARPRARAAAAAERPARGARQRAAVRRHAAAAESEVGQAGAAGRLGAGRAAAHRGAVGASSARALPGGPDRLDPRRAHRAEPRHPRGASRRSSSRSPPRQPLFQLWWVTGAVIEALQESGLEGGVSIKRLLGLADREIKRLYEQGEARYAQNRRRSSC